MKHLPVRLGRDAYGFNKLTHSIIEALEERGGELWYYTERPHWEVRIDGTVKRYASRWKLMQEVLG